jgi:hypothetical protein
MLWSGGRYPECFGRCHEAHRGQPTAAIRGALPCLNRARADSDSMPQWPLRPALRDRHRPRPWLAASITGSTRVGQHVGVAELEPVDLVVCGSVAVNRQGARIGKGGGFSDLEVAFLVEAAVIRPDTVLATTVHRLQVVDEPLAETIHDFRVDLIVTPDEAIWCAEPHRPPGILWEHLDQDKIAEVPALAALAAGR